MSAPVEKGPGDGGDLWVASIHVSRDGVEPPVGSGFLVDGDRVMTSAHVVVGLAAAASSAAMGAGGSDSLRRPPLWVAFPKAETLIDHRVAVRRVVVPERPERLRLDDVAVLVLAEALPTHAAARLRRPEPGKLVQQPWWAFGFPDDEFGDASHGVVDGALGYGWVRLKTLSGYPVRPGFSGAALWSPDYDAVVGLIGQANSEGNARALTLWQAARSLPAQRLDSLTEWSVEAAGESALAAWGWTLARDREARRHWLPRARGVGNDAEPGFRFRGRTAALNEIVRRIRGPELDRKALVVTGSPGVGKSAVLGRIVTTADADIAASLPPEDDAVRAPIGSVSCAVHAKGKTALEVAAEIARAASATVKLYEPADLPPALREALSQNAVADGGGGAEGGIRSDSGRRFTVVIDALDETTSAAEARAVVRRIVLPLVEDLADLGVRVVVGSRRRDAEGDLLAAFGPAARVVDLDHPEYFAQEDLAAYTLASLQLLGAARVGNPYERAATAAPVAERIAALADRNFLIAGLVARSHGLHDTVAIDPAQIAFTPTMDAVLTEYLARVPGVDGTSATQLLTVLAFAEAPGFSARLWSASVEAVLGNADSGAAITPRQLRDFTRTAAANFLVETSGADRADWLADGNAAEDEDEDEDDLVAVDDGPTFRLFHQALNDVLIAARHERVAEERAIAGRLTALGRELGWHRAPAYLLRALPGHAARGAAVDALLREDEYPLYADLRRLILASAQTRSAAGQRRADLLRRTPRAITADPQARAALFSVTEAQEKLGDTYRHAFPTLTSRFPRTLYRALWAETAAQREFAVLEGHGGPVTQLCRITAPDGRALIASASTDRTVRIWDPGTGSSDLIIDTGAQQVRALYAIPVADGRELLGAVAEESARLLITLWDPVTGRREDRLTSDVRSPWAPTWPTGLPKGPFSEEIGRIGLDPWDPVAARWAGEVRAVPGGCLARRRSGAIGVVSAQGKTAHLYLLDSKRPPVSFYSLAGNILAMCPVVGAQGKPLLVTGTDEGDVRTWSVETAAADRAFAGHRGAVRVLCPLPQEDGSSLFASGGEDFTVHIWDPATGSLLNTLMGHTAAVYAICAIPGTEHGDMLATAGADNVVRLWREPTSVRLSADAPAPSGSVRGLCVLPAVGGARQVASYEGGGTEAVLRIRDLDSGEVVRDHSAAPDMVSLCAMPPDDEPAAPIAPVRKPALLAAGFADGSMAAWNDDPERRVAIEDRRTFSDPVRVIKALSVDDAKALISIDTRGRVRMWRSLDQLPATGTIGYSLKPNLRACVLPSDGPSARLALANERSVEEWFFAPSPSGDRISVRANWPRLVRHGTITALCPTPVTAADETLIAIGCSDGSVELWDLIAEVPTMTLAGSPGAVRDLCTLSSADGRTWLAGAGDDRIVRIWDPLHAAPVLEIPVRHRLTRLAAHGNHLVVGMVEGIMALEISF